MEKVINIYLDRPLTPKVWTHGEGTDDSNYKAIKDVEEKHTKYNT